MTEINIAMDFSTLPGGRFKKDGPFSGEEFREKWLLPALRSGQEVKIYLDDTYGYPSSFLEEAFGGAIRIMKKNKESGLNDILSKIKLIASDAYQIYVQDIKHYLMAELKKDNP